MNEEKIVKKQLLKNMLLNLIFFTVIFTIFGSVIFNSLKNYIYKSANEELIMSLDKLSKNYDFPLERKELAPRDIINPRIISILRDINGNIQNINSLGQFYNSYSEFIKYDKTYLNKVYELNINGYYYMGLNSTFENQNGETLYTQLLINIDSEKSILDNYFIVILWGIIITVCLSVLASYILAKETLKPIIESWKSQTEFVQNASHELRTPLTIIKAKQELLLKKPESKIIEQSENITLTLNEVNRLTKLTKDLMALASADMKEQKMIKENMNIDDLIREITKPYIEFASIQSKEIILNLNYKNEISIDRSKISELLVILLDNAIKYTEKNDKIEVRTFSKDGKFILEVYDTGIGISDDGIKHIFDRFYREDKARSRETGGSGLGLSIANLIVTLHGGTIKAEHNTPKGTIFKVKLNK